MIFSDLEIIFCNLNETGHISTEYEYYRLLFCIILIWARNNYSQKDKDLEST